MNRDPGDICRVDDDPYSDYSNFSEGLGVFRSNPERDPDELLEEARLKRDSWDHVPSRNIGSLADLLPDCED